LQPLEQDLPIAPERVRPHFKLAKIQHHRYLTAFDSRAVPMRIGREFSAAAALRCNIDPWRALLNRL
jgi:hypothetical protein